MNAGQPAVQKKSRGQRLWKDIKRDRYLLAIFLLPLLYFIIFKYGPMYGVLIAFKKYNFQDGILGSPWVGFQYFRDFLTDPYFYKLFRNTFLLSIYSIAVGFPMPIILALLLNELKNAKFKKFVQTASYLPHFISTVVVCGMIVNFVATDGMLNQFLSLFGLPRVNYLSHPQYFRSVYVLSDVWQQMGWGSIIYLAALSGVDMQLYEAARIDGASRWKQATSITLPCISNTIIVMLLLRIGSLMSIGFEKVLVLYNSAVYETADVISTYVYRRGMVSADFSYATAIGIFESLIGLFFLLVSNGLARKYSETSLF